MLFKMKAFTQKIKKSILLFNYSFLKNKFIRIKNINLYLLLSKTKYIKNFNCFELKKKKFISYQELQKKLIIVIDNYNSKKLYKKNITKVKPFLINSSIFIYEHKHIIDKNINQNQTALIFSPKKKQILFNLFFKSKIELKSLYKIFLINIIKKFFYSQEIIKNFNYIYKFSIKAEDIVTGLLYIEKIFESKKPLFENLISLKTTILISNTKKIFYPKLFIFYLKISFISVEQNINIKLQKKILNNLFSLKTISLIVSGGTVFTLGEYSIDKILEFSFINQLRFQDSLYKATKFSFIYIYNVILESLITQYNFNGIYLPTIHFELIIKKMISCVFIEYPGNTIFKQENICSFNIIYMLNSALKFYDYDLIIYKPKLLGITQSTLISSSMLASISFQETIKLLLDNILNTKINWIVDLKSKIIASDLLPTGTGWFRYFNKKID